MADKRFCVGCEDESEETHMFKVNIHDHELEKWVDEIYCNECVANIMTEEPGIVSYMEAI